MEILIGVIKDTVPEKIEHHFDGMCAFGPCLVLRWFMKASFIYPTENSKTNHQRSALSRINRKESGTEIGHSLEFDFVVPPPHS